MHKCKCDKNKNSSENMELKMWCVDQILHKSGKDPLVSLSSEAIIAEADKLFDYITGGKEKEKELLKD